MRRKAVNRNVVEEVVRYMFHSVTDYVVKDVQQGSSCRRAANRSALSDYQSDDFQALRLQSCENGPRDDGYGRATRRSNSKPD